MMKKFIATALIALSLGGCAQLTNAIGVKNPITNNSLGSVIDSYGLAQSAFIAYASLPRCTKTKPFSATNYCHKRSVLVAGQAYDHAVNQAINTAVTFQRENPTLDASAYIQAAQSALNVFTQFETMNGVK